MLWIASAAMLVVAAAGVAYWVKRHPSPAGDGAASSVEGDPASSETEWAPPLSSSVSPQDTADKDAEVKQLYEEAVKFAQEHPGDFEESLQKLHKVELEGLGTAYAIKAERERMRLEKAHDKEANTAWQALETRANNLAADAKFAEALQEIENFPKTFRIPAVVKRIPVVRHLIEEEARERYEGMEQEAEKLRDEGQFEEARQLYESAKQFGVRSIQKMAEDKLAELSVQEDEVLEELAEENLPQYEVAFEDVKSLAKVHRYAEAEKMFDALTADRRFKTLKTQVAQDRAMLAEARLVFQAAVDSLSVLAGKKIVLKGQQATLKEIKEEVALLSSGGTDYTVPLHSLPTKDILRLATPLLEKQDNKAWLHIAAFYLMQDNLTSAQEAMDKAQAKGIDISPYEAWMDAFLVITTSPEGASIRFSPKVTGLSSDLKTPARVKLKKKMTYVLHLNKRGYETLERKVLLNRGGEFPLTLKLASLEAVEKAEEEEEEKKKEQVKVAKLKERLRDLPEEYLPKLRVFHGHLYLYVAERMTWRAAAQRCEGWNGHLVTLSSRVENDFVFKTVTEENPAWIGFTDQAQEGLWRWITGERVPYTNWQEGEPNDFGRGPQMAGDFACGLGNGEWVNYRPGVLNKQDGLGFICEWE